MTSSTSMVAILAAGAAGLVNTPSAFGQAAASSGDSQLAEIVVTATRQSSTVNRVPLSVAALTQETLDQQGIKALSDLQRIVPALAVVPSVGGIQQFTIRGIGATQGPATTGVYLDDTPIQKRNSLGPAGVALNGTPVPPLFDLARVEVLRGPQGTLYGGSSQGGTLRFITPAPSLTAYTAAASAEISSVADGDLAHEIGAAMGGPIVPDVLGFRVSGLLRNTSGYIDMYDPYNGRLLFEDANERETRSFRGSVLWAPSEPARITASFYHSRVEDKGGLQQWNVPVEGTFTTPASCYNTTRQFGQVPGPRAPVACPAGAIPGQTVNGVYQRPAQTYGPFPYFGRNKAIGIALQPVTTELNVGSIAVDYDFGGLDARLISSYVYDRTSAYNLGPVNEASNDQVTTAFPTSRGFPLFATRQDHQGRFPAFNKRSGFIEELRLTSDPESGRFSWVAGAYFSSIKAEGNFHLERDLEAQTTRPLWGLTPTQAYGLPQVGDAIQNDQKLDDTEYALFGEGTLRLTDALKAIAGVRVSRVEFDFWQAFRGALVGWNEATIANTGLTRGSVTETPVTPKFSLQYDFPSDRMLYATAAKGFRAGGVNTPLTPSVCGQALVNAGLTPADIPVAYDSDSVWSYELGSKVRLLSGRLQINSSVYRINWDDVQLAVGGLPGCPQTWVQNAGTAVSQGGDIDAQARWGRVTASVAVGYTDAKYTETIRAPAAPGAVGVPVVRDGDTFPVPVWQGSLGARYDFNLGTLDAFVRADYLYQGKYFRSAGPGVTQYAPDTRQAPSSRQVNTRAGLSFDSWSVEVFANNLFDSDDELTRAGGRGGCLIAQGAVCSTFTQYNPFQTVGTLRPRELGVRAAYRFE